jgi:hypothetical protein
VKEGNDREEENSSYINRSDHGIRAFCLREEG